MTAAKTPCPTCKGSGWKEHPDDCWKSKPCPTCRGNGKPAAAYGQRAGLKPLAEATIRIAFKARHDSPQMRDLARLTIRDGRLALRLRGRFPYGSR